MKKQVILEGFLAEEYGREWAIKASSYKDIFQCIEANYPGFKDRMINAVDNGTNFTILHGDSYIDEGNLYEPLSEKTITITPIPTGAKSGGAKILAGVAILAAVFFLPVLPAVVGGAATLAGAAGGLMTGTATASTAASIGIMTAFNAGMALGLNLVLVGVQQLLAPDPSVDDNEDNYLFDGPEQVTFSGQPVPYLYGKKIVSGIPISSDIAVGKIPKTSSVYTGPGFNISTVFSDETQLYLP